MKKLNLVFAASFATSLLAACNLPPAPSLGGAPAAGMAKMFTVTLESPADGPGPLSPGVFVIHKEGMPLFTPGQKDMGKGLEGIAEDGDPGMLAGKMPNAMVFNTPVGDEGPGPATPGKSYQFSFRAEPGDRLSFATMYVQSNDAFYAPDAKGFPLFDGNMPITGDMTAKIMLWDAGTEVNQEPGVGEDQAPRQAGPNTGDSESENIALISERDDFTYAPGIKFTIEAK